MQRYWLVCYDVSLPKRLRKVARVMQNYGLRVQKSVFECWLNDAQLQNLRRELAKIIDEQEDSVRFYSLCETCRKRTTAKTKTPLRNNQSYYIV